MTSKTDPNVASDETLIERFRGRIKHSDVCRVHRWGDCDCDREQLQTELAQLLSALQQQRDEAMQRNNQLTEMIEALSGSANSWANRAEAERDSARHARDAAQGSLDNACRLLSDVQREAHARAEAAAAENKALRKALAMLLDDYLLMAGDGMTESTEPALVKQARAALAPSPSDPPARTPEPQ